MADDTRASMSDLCDALERVANVAKKMTDIARWLGAHLQNDTRPADSELGAAMPSCDIAERDLATLRAQICVARPAEFREPVGPPHFAKHLRNG